MRFPPITEPGARGGCESPVTASVDGTDGSWIVLSNDSFMLSLHWVLARLREDRVFEGRRNLKENLLFRVSFAFLHNVLLSPIAIPYSWCLAASCPRPTCVFWWIRVCTGTRDLPIARVVRARAMGSSFRRRRGGGSEAVVSGSSG